MSLVGTRLVGPHGSSWAIYFWPSGSLSGLAQKRRDSYQKVAVTGQGCYVVAPVIEMGLGMELSAGGLRGASLMSESRSANLYQPV